MSDKIKILIVEDSETIGLQIKNLLESKDFHILSIVRSGEEALQYVEKKLPDLIIMDIFLRGKIDGIDTAMKINRKYDIPIVFLTGKSDPQHLERIKKTNLSGYLTKPIRGTDLYYTLVSALIKQNVVLEFKKSEERYRTFIGLLQYGIEGISIAGEILLANEFSHKMYEYEKGELVGKKLSCILATEAEEKSTLNYLIALAEKKQKPASYFGQRKTKTGKIIDVKIDWNYRLDKDNNIIDFIAVITNITKQKRTEASLRNAHDEIKTILSSLTTILIGVSIDDKITHWNKVAENIFNIPASKCIGKYFTHSNINWDWSRIYRGISTCILEEKSVKLRNISFENSDKNSGILDLIINSIKDTESNTKGFLITGEDITERRNLETQLAQAQKLESIGQLSSGIAHEINTPAQYITDNTYFCKESFSAFNKIMKKNMKLIQLHKSGKDINKIMTDIDTIFTDSDIKYLLKETSKAIDQSLEGLSHVTKIVQSMKIFAHPGVKNRTPIDINKAIENTIIISRNEWKYIADIIISLDKAISPVLCFPGEFSQAILNLIINAAQAIEEKLGKSPQTKGKIDIVTSSEEKWVCVKIKDTGVGIPSNVMNKIFDPFFTTKEIGKGTGQGLSIVRDVIVKKNKGKLFVKSKVGEGTTFMIKLPKGDMKYAGDK